jgi:hypothetical protein
MADNVPEEDKPRKRVNVEATIANLIGLGALPDGEQASLEHFVLSIEEILKKIRRVSSRVAFLGRSTTHQDASLSLEKHQACFNRKASQPSVVLC